MKIFSNAAWLIVSRIASDAISFLLFIVIAREFGPAGLGIYAFHFAIATIFYELITLGIEEYGVREYALRATEERVHIIGNLVGAQLAVAAVSLLVASTLLLTELFDKTHVTLLAFMVVYQLGCAVAQTLFIPSFVAGRIPIQASSEILSRSGILLLALFLLGTGDRSLTTTLVGLPVFGVALMLVAGTLARVCGSSVVPRFSLQIAREMTRALWSFAAANVLSTVYARIGGMLLFVIAGTVPAGLFASVYKFAEVGWNVLYVVPWAAYAHLSRMYDSEPERYRAVSAEVLKTSLLLAGVIAWGMAWVLPWMVPLLLGAEYAGTEMVLKGLAVFVLLLGSDVYLSRLMLVAGLQPQRLKVILAQTAIAAILGVLLIPDLGVYGAVIGLVGGQLAATVLELWVLRREPDLGRVLWNLGKFAACVLVAAAAGELAWQQSSHWWLGASASLVVLLLAARLAGLVPVPGGPLVDTGHVSSGGTTYSD